MEDINITELIKRSAMLDMVLSCKCDRAFPSETEKMVIQVKKVLGVKDDAE